jgi:hypothetical protein
MLKYSRCVYGYACKQRIQHLRKGDDSLLVGRYVIHALRKLAANHPDQKFGLMLEASEAIDYAFSEMYSHGLFIDAEHGLPIGRAGMTFLQLQAKLIKICKYRFLQQPKLHMLHHIFATVIDDCLAHDICLNPLAEAVPMNEDFIGKLSRASRRVAQRLVSLRTLQSALLLMKKALRQPFEYGRLHDTA